MFHFLFEYVLTACNHQSSFIFIIAINPYVWESCLIFALDFYLTRDKPTHVTSLPRIYHHSPIDQNGVPTLPTKQLDH